jgi:ATP-dependent DNA helicase RecG
MARLLQGEVGSGKTAVAAAALLVAVANGAQGALMAPTEILAEQHFRSITTLYERAGASLAAALGRPPRVALLTGSTPRGERRTLLRAVASGAVDILIGTHALIQEDVEFARLALAVVDEQHRFGVRQRLSLRAKGTNPHLLVMTATPIPRTLALTLYGDLDLSTIDELPPGRQRIRTLLLRSAERHLAYEHIRREVAKGRQAFVICPLVEESPHLEARAAVEEYERLRHGELAGLRLALLHGRMRPAEKDEVMRAFRAGQFDVLVSTAVVEVGVDVPNATAMLIEGAERFGLAQLHQFRGRVGRGPYPSACLLVTDSETPEAVERLVTMERVDNGLALAEEDLRLRGPGDLVGVRQSGLPDLRFARLTETDLVEQARRGAARLLAADPDLSHPDHRALRAALELFWERIAEPN